MKKIYLLLFIVLSTFIFSHNVYAAEGDRVYIQISEDGEIVSATHFDVNDIDVYDVDNYYNYDGDVLTFTNSAFYIVESGYYDLEVNQDYDGPIGLRLFNDGDLLLDGLNVVDGYYITANGEMTIKNSKIKLIGYDNDSLGQINTQDDLIIDNSEVKCINGSDDRTGLGHIHSYYGDIYIKNKSKVRVDDRLYTDDCSIYR